MAKRSLYSHRRRILNFQPHTMNTTIPGTFCWFRYQGNKIRDPQPLVLVLWNDDSDHKIHGINLNYLSEYKMKDFIRKITKGSNFTNDEEKNLIVVDNPKDEDVKEQLPPGNIKTESYTRVNIPAYKVKRKGKELTSSQIKSKMRSLYTNVVKKLH